MNNIKAIVKAASPLVRRDKVGSTLRVLLNIITGWSCIGFCAGEDVESQAKCHEICGIGRMEMDPPRLNTKE